MALGKYIKTINNTKVIMCNREQLVIDIFKASGYSDDISTETVKKWIDKDGKRNYRKYFPNENVNEANFVKYFRDRTNNTWEKLQEAFRSVNDNDIINCNTDDKEVFYRSLLNQFLDVIGLPWTAESDNTTYKPNEPSIVQSKTEDVIFTENDMDVIFTGNDMDVIFTGNDMDVIFTENEVIVASPKELLPEQMNEIFKISFDEHGIENFIKVDPTCSLKSHFFDDVKQFIGAIKCNVEHAYDIYKTEVTYQTISNFTNTLLDYITYLNGNMKEIRTPIDASISYAFAYNVTYVPSTYNDNNDFTPEFCKETNDYRQKLSLLYSDICAGEKLL